jgi:hypothetical protein
MKYAIKKINRYFTKNGGWSKDIFKADLQNYESCCNFIRDCPGFFGNSHIVPVIDEHIREEVRNEQ